MFYKNLDFHHFKKFRPPPIAEYLVVPIIKKTCVFLSLAENSGSSRSRTASIDLSTASLIQNWKKRNLKFGKNLFIKLRGGHRTQFFKRNVDEMSWIVQKKTSKITLFFLNFPKYFWKKVLFLLNKRSV